jgi:predicted nucleic acid-binding protein
MSKPIRIYWDSCAWIGLINGEPDKRRELEIIYTHAKQGKYEIWTSALSLIEVRKLSSEAGKPRPLPPENLSTIRAVFIQPCVKTIPVSSDISDQACEIFRNTPGLNKWQDSIHLASALKWSIPIMHTYDHVDLIAVSAKFECKNGETLIIIYPDETTDGPLFAKKSG